MYVHCCGFKELDRFLSRNLDLEAVQGQLHKKLD